MNQPHTLSPPHSSLDSKKNPSIISPQKKGVLLNWLIVGLTILIALAYAQTYNDPFFNIDDAGYVYQNEFVKDGISINHIKEAFTKNIGGNYHPITMLSHMLDAQLWGLKPGMHRATNVLFHIINTLLLIALLTKTTGRKGLAIIAASLFSLHPLRVESIAWISERKDVLCVTFSMLSLLCYVSYVSSAKKTIYILSLFFFALGLLSKPMVVTLPCVMLLLDFWPLNRTRINKTSSSTIPPIHQIKASNNSLKWAKLALEKVPFFSLSIASSVITFYTQKDMGAMTGLGDISWPQRLANTFISYTRYLGKFIWPRNLAFFYPYETWTNLQIASALLLLIALTILVVWHIRTMPFLAFGWFWFLGTMIPVIGLIQVGVQSMADRYMYLPSIGLCIAITWSLDHLINWRKQADAPIFATNIAITMLLATLTWHQTSYWKNSRTVWEHVQAVTVESSYTQYHLARLNNYDNHFAEAAKHYQKAIVLTPRPLFYRQYYDMLAKTSQLKKAHQLAQTFIQDYPNNADSYRAMAQSLIALNQKSKALIYAKKAIEQSPTENINRMLAASLMVDLQQLDHAIDQLKKVLAQSPENWSARYALFDLLLKQKKKTQAITQLKKLIHDFPTHPSTPHLKAKLSQIESLHQALPKRVPQQK